MFLFLPRSSSLLAATWSTFPATTTGWYPQPWRTFCLGGIRSRSTSPAAPLQKSCTPSPTEGTPPVLPWRQRGSRKCIRWASLHLLAPCPAYWYLFFHSWPSSTTCSSSRMTPTTSCSSTRYRRRHQTLLFRRLNHQARTSTSDMGLGVVTCSPAAVGALFSLHGCRRENHPDGLFLENPVFRVRAAVYFWPITCTRVVKRWLVLGLFHLCVSEVQCLQDLLSLHVFPFSSLLKT